MPQASKGLKITLGGIVSVITIVTFSLPYLELKTQAGNFKKELETLKTRVELDHDLIIRMSSDLSHVRTAVDKIDSKLNK